MLVNSYKNVYLSWISTDLPVWHTIETKASLYQKDCERFHLLLTQQNLPHSVSPSTKSNQHDKGLFWLEISPYRVMMTMQSNSKLSYRHFWERGIYGVSRYCLNTSLDRPNKSLRFRNFTHYLKVDNDPFPKNLHIQYEMWSQKLKLGSYVFHLNIEA